MDSWEHKMPSWDLGTVVAPSGGGGGGGGGGGALDLKLGAPTSWRPIPAAVASVQQQQPPPPPSAAPAQAKRARAGQGQQTVPPCSVEGCTADLSRCREYHRRHKVCEAHSKTPVVAVAGQQQRFCQQCSRFHLLGEFDEVKRSCRKRLDGHNRRRRKPQPDPLNPAGLFANHHGVTRFGSYPQIFSPTSMAEPKWHGGIAVKTEADAFHEQYYSFSGAAASLFHHGKPERKHFPFLTDGGDATFGCQPPAFTITPSSESSSNSSRHSNGKTTMFAHDGGPDHNCALSLLSDNPAPAHIMVPTEAHHLGGGGGGVTIQYGGGGKVARLSSNGDVSLTGLSYVSLGDKGGAPMLHTSNRSQHAAATATTAVTTSTAPAPAASQMQQYHGYYHHQHQVSADQGNHPDAGGMHALPFSSW